ncbi:MAG: hypothetical protein KGR26_08710, partial [Cyanobacteria bacterium REEB65]|nr:hypothetical protein [Cyanobacteria bacterium REEB65]
MTPRGGKREGAGRKPKPEERGVPVTFWLPPETKTWLDQMTKNLGTGSRSKVLVGAIETLRGGHEARQAAMPLPVDLMAWLEAQAASSGITPAELLALIVADARDIAGDPSTLAAV